MAEGGPEATAAAAEEVRRGLEASVAEITRLGPGADEAHVSAFNAFVRGVTHASSGRLATPAQLLASLQPKGPVWRFLVELHERKRIQRKRVVAAVALLLQVGAWLAALRGDAELCASLPQALQELLQEHAGTECKAVEELPPPAKQSCEPSAAAVLLSEAKSDVAALDFCAADLDAAIMAFEKFRRAVVWAVQGAATEKDSLLEGLEPKGRFLEFLTDFYDRKRQYRGRVASALLRLLDFKSWRDAAVADKSLHAAVRDLMVDEGRETRGDTFVGEASPNTGLDIGVALARATAEGCVGLLYVRVLAAHNLVRSDGCEASMSAFARVTLGHRTKRTEIESGSANPRWDAAPFLFQVPAMDSSVVIKVLDSDIVRDEELGTLRIYVTDAPAEAEAPSDLRWRQGAPWQALRYSLDEVAHGEVELEVAFFGGPAKCSAGGGGGSRWRPLGLLAGTVAAGAPTPLRASASSAAGAPTPLRSSASSKPANPIVFLDMGALESVAKAHLDADGEACPASPMATSRSCFLPACRHAVQGLGHFLLWLRRAWRPDELSRPLGDGERRPAGAGP